MKTIKKYIILISILFLLPLVVQAGNISFSQAEKTSPTTYRFKLTVNDINLNYINGKLNITNGTITNITMSSGWVNKTGKNNTFYFYRNGIGTGNYIVATFDVTITDNSRYDVIDLNYGIHKCTVDKYNLYYNENGNIVSKSEFESSVCGVSKDATLKSLTVSQGTLSPKFNSALELYSVQVENKVSMLTFYPTTNQAKAKVISGTTCSLNVGANLCRIVVQAESGNTKTYTITVMRKNEANNNMSTDASIRNLQVHNGVLTKNFDPNVKEYHVKVNKGASYIYFTFIANSNKETYTSQKCNVTPDTTTCTLTITAEDKKTKNSYVFHLLQNGNNSNTNNNSSSSNNGGNSTSDVVIGDSKNNFENKVPTNNDKNNENFNDIDLNNNDNKTDNAISTEGNCSNPSIQKENDENNMNNELETMIIPFINKPISKNLVLKITIIIAALFIGMVFGKFIKNYRKRK